MEPTTDPITYLMTGGGVGGGAVGGYILSRVLGNNSNNGKHPNPDLVAIANKLDRTNELLNELLRSQARLEGVLSK